MTSVFQIVDDDGKVDVVCLPTLSGAGVNL